MLSGTAARTTLGASFRDPTGFMYREGGVLYRQVNSSSARHYGLLMNGGLYDALVGQSRLIPHQEVDGTSSSAYKTLRPDVIPYVSYPYEWCFSQLRDAALLTLEIQLTSLSFGMTLKDASAYNVQFIGHRPVFIDTLSFQEYDEGSPWVAYRQFCQHFLGPLALMSHVDVRLRHLLRSFIDGIPLSLASRLLPARTRLRPGLLAHIHLHAASQRQHQAPARPHRRVRAPSLPKGRLIALIENLRATVRGCSAPQEKTEWGDYYRETNYSPDAMEVKEALVRRMVDAVADPADLIHDIGANTGRFSRLLAGPGRYVVSHDIDELAVERHYVRNRSEGVEHVLPLLLDLTNPSPSIGWSLEERTSAIERVSRGTVIALALVHHLAISNNVPLDGVAALFHRLANTLIIEFVPKEDSQVQRLLASREDVFPRYTFEEFLRVFSAMFEVREQHHVPGTSRTLFAMRRKD